MVIFALIALIVLIPYILMIFNPMRRPHEMATNYVLRLTPIGMDMEEAINVLEGHRNWNININYDRGFAHPRPSIDRPHPRGGFYIVGEKSISAWAHPSGSGYWPGAISTPIYGWFFRTTVSVFWGFDENEKLIEVYVRQSHSS